ncbi:MAG: spore germination protein [Firmicutes bacterium]|nr:spore germination protein [Bacillota bacterium]
MIRFLLRKLRLARHYKEIPTPLADDSLQKNIEKNIALFRAELGESPDIVIRRFTLKLKKEIKAAIIFVEGLMDQQVVYDCILRPLMLEAKKETRPVGPDLLGFIQENLIPAAGLEQENRLSPLVAALLGGDTVLLLEGQAAALIINTKNRENRASEEPDTEVTILGPRDGFTEDLRTNTALLRRKIGDPRLVFEQMMIGRRTRTIVAIAYVQGIANEKVVEEVRARLKRINTDMILDANYLREFIADAPFSPFPTVGFTERPDVAAARLLEGRVAVFTDTTPVVNTMPALFIEAFQNPDDYNTHFLYATFIRWLRYLAFLISFLLPALFVALTTYHQELIPTPLLISMAAAVEGTPFPMVIEVVAMGAIFEIIREAGVRLARPIGQTISIVGALVIGEAVVSAGLVAAPTVIVVALTAITSFVVPTQQEIGIILRLSLAVLAGILGAYGIILGLLFTLSHLASLRSFGVPYLSPVIPLNIGDLKDVAVRVPLWAMWTRPRVIGWHEPRRQNFGESAPPSSAVEGADLPASRKSKGNKERENLKK